MQTVSSLHVNGMFESMRLNPLLGLASKIFRNIDTGDEQTLTSQLKSEMTDTTSGVQDSNTTTQAQGLVQMFCHLSQSRIDRKRPFATRLPIPEMSQAQSVADSRLNSAVATLQQRSLNYNRLLCHNYILDFKGPLC